MGLLMLFFGLLLTLGVKLPESKLYRQWGWITTMGADVMKSKNYMIFHVVGDRFVGIAMNAMEKIESGFFTVLKILNLSPEEQNAYDIAWVKAYTHRGGWIIPEAKWQNDNTPYFIWEINDPGKIPAGYSYSLDNEPDDELDTTGKSVQIDSAIPDGKHRFYVKAQNNAGTWGEVGVFNIWIDTHPPSIEKVEPRSGELLNQRNKPIKIWFKDNLSGIDARSVECKVNNRRVYLKYDKKCDCYVSYGLLPEGKVTVYVQAKDAAGNRLKDYMWGFSVDTLAPTGSVEINYGAPVTRSLTVRLSFDARDNYSGVSKVRVGNTKNECINSGWIDYSSEIEWRLRPFSGQQSVFVQFMDKAGNISGVYSDSIMVELIAPDTIIVSGPSGVTKDRDAFFKYRGTKEDCYFSWKLDDGKWSRWTKEDSVMLVNLADGRHVFSVKAAKDMNNNHVIEEEEIDPTPAQRIWFVGDVAIWRPFVKLRFWRVE